MTPEEFKNGLIKIEETFSKQYSQHQLELLDDSFGHYNFRRWNALTKEVLSASRSFPTVNDFKKADLELRISLFEDAKENQSKDVKENWTGEPKANAYMTKETSEYLSNILKSVSEKMPEHEARWRANHLTGEYHKNIIHFPGEQNFELRSNPK